MEKILTFHNFIILIKSVVNKNKNNYYYNTFLEKGSYEDKSYIYIFKCVFADYKCYISIKLTFLEELMLNKRNASKEYDNLH